jgi:hypothetical protein
MDKFKVLLAGPLHQPHALANRLVCQDAEKGMPVAPMVLQARSHVAPADEPGKIVGHHHHHARCLPHIGLPVRTIWDNNAFVFVGDLSRGQVQYVDFKEAQEEAIPCHSRRGLTRESIMTHS